MVAPGVACVVAPGGVSVVAPGGGMRGIRRDTEIRSMRGQYASHWNAFLYTVDFILTDSIDGFKGPKSL